MRRIWWDCIRHPVVPGVFGSLSHFRRSSGAVPPRAPCRWAHVWRNEPRAITRCLCDGVQCRLPMFCLPLSAPPPLLLISVPSPPQHLSLSPLPFHASLLPPTRGGHVLELRSLCGRDSAGGPAKRAHRDAAAHLRVVLLENLPVHASTR